MSVLDREVNCRRAASAAFQEHVGRQGTFPHGIEIITLADFFALGSRSRAYLEIAPEIAKYGRVPVEASLIAGRFEEYREPLIFNLVTTKVGHWDKVVREQAAKALHRIAPLARDLFCDKLIAEFCERSLSEDFFERHGALLALGECLSGLGPARLTFASVRRCNAPWRLIELLLVCCRCHREARESKAVSWPRRREHSQRGVQAHRTHCGCKPASVS